jgi:hypothetical protein
MLRANTAKFAGKFLKLNRLNFSFIRLFESQKFEIGNRQFTLEV